MFSARLLAFFAAVIQSEASRILAVFPTPSISHQVVFRPLILELIKRGHEVVLMTTDPIYKKDERPSNLTEIDVHDVSYQVWREGFVNRQDQSVETSKTDIKEQMTLILDLMNEVFEKQMNTDEMQRMLNDKSIKYDLLILEAYFSALLGLSYVYKNVPVIQVSSLGPTIDNLRTLGTSMHAFMYPTFVQQKIHDLTLWEKLGELRNYYWTDEMFRRNEELGDILLERLIGKDVPKISELYKNVDMVFVNVHPIWDSNRPVPPNMVYMGGLHQKPVKELPQDLKTYLDASKHGVIYISFGTNVETSLLPAEKIQAMIDVLSKLPYDVLWKWNQDELPGRTGNIKISKWLPQSDLLRHPKVKLFITQGGLQSTDEAITAGVPLLGMPMLADQWYNVELYVRHKIGLRIDMEMLTEKKFRDAVQTIVENKSFHDNILRLRSIITDQPQTPLERAAWWTEYVLRNKGAKHLRSPAAIMPWTQYLELELVFHLFIVLISVVIVLGITVYCIYKRFAKHQCAIKLKNT